MIWIILIIINSGEHLKSFLHQKSLLPRIVIFSLCAFINLILSILSIIKPNEFTKSKLPYQESLVKSRTESAFINKKYFDFISCKIHDYKIKTIEDRQVIIYNICIKINNDIQIVKRTYKEFEKLNASIRLIFPKELFPRMEIPNLPAADCLGLTIDQKIITLNEYLSKICVIDYFNETTLNFFGINGILRENILKEHYSVLDSESTFQAFSQEGTDFIDLTQINFENHSESVFEDQPINVYCIMRYVNIKIQVSSENEKIFYQIKSRSILGKRSIRKTYKDFINLHKVIKKLINAEIIPKFPKKSYFLLPSKKDLASAELRRVKLEKYLIHILNDPAYHIQEIFQFIGIQEDFKELWGVRSIKYEITAPIEWETDINEPGSIIFIITIRKSNCQQAYHQWQTRRYYKELETLHNFLIKRNESIQLSKYYEFMQIQFPVDLPVLPKNMKEMSNIEELRENIEFFLEKLFRVPLIQDAYVFTNFLNDTSGNLSWQNHYFNNKYAC